MHKMLTKSGIIDIATDHEDYANWIVEHFLERKDFTSIYKKGFTREMEKGHIETYFEKKKRDSLCSTRPNAYFNCRRDDLG